MPATDAPRANDQFAGLPVIEYDAKHPLENPTRTVYRLNPQFPATSGCLELLGVFTFVLLAVISILELSLHNPKGVMWLFIAGLVLAALAMWKIVWIISTVRRMIWGRSDCPYCGAVLVQPGAKLCFQCHTDWTDPQETRFWEYGDPIPVDHKVTVGQRYPLAALVADPRASDVAGLVVGHGFHGEDDTQSVVESSERLRGLRFLALGSFDPDQMEQLFWVDWGQLDDVLDAYPLLDHLRVCGLRAELRAAEHPQLRSLELQIAAISDKTVRAVVTSQLPQLERLELWLCSGTDFCPLSPQDLQRLWEPGRFPALRSLALRNCPFTDQLVADLIQSPLFRQLRELDLSYGTLSDSGGKLLLESPDLRRLERLNLQHHYLSPPVVLEFQRLANVNLSDPQPLRPGMTRTPAFFDWD